MGSSRAAAVAAGLVALGLLAGACAPLPGGDPVDDAGPVLGVAVAGSLSSYNPATATGGDGGGALGRVLPGFGVLGPEGEPVADTDVGVVTPLSTDPLQVRYTFTPAATWSDGTAMECADLVLAWVARSGDRSGAAADTRGYTDVAGIDCAAGERTATVRFTRPYQDWRGLFGAGALLPAHVAEQRSGAGSVVAAVAAGDTAALDRLAEFWATGWALPTGPADAAGEVALDPALFPASGPYRLAAVVPARGELVLAANERWWGDPALVPRVVVRTAPTDPAGLLAGDAVQALAVPADPALRDAVGAAGSPLGATTTSSGLSLRTESLVLDTRGALRTPAARRAVAGCVPRAELLAEQVTPLAPGAVVLDSHLLLPDQLGYAATTAPAAPFAAVDPAAARAAVQAAGLAGTTVRVARESAEQARAVALIAESCAAAGLTVVDAGELGPGALAAGTADAALVRAGGSAAVGAAAAGLRTGAATAWGGWSDPRLDELLGRLETTPALADQLPLLTEAETILWDQLPSLPLHQVPTVTAAVDRLPSVVPNPSAAGIAWNVDRWALTP